MLPRCELARIKIETSHARGTSRIAVRDIAGQELLLFASRLGLKRSNVRVCMQVALPDGTMAKDVISTLDTIISTPSLDTVRHLSTLR